MSDFDLPPLGTVVAGGEPKLTIRILKKCNFQCPGCGTFSGPDGQGIISLTDIERIVTLLDTENFSGVINISGGEPTLHPNLDAIVTCLSTGLPNSKIILFTNGSWIGLEGWENLLTRLFPLQNVLLRFSYDPEHITGESRASGKDLQEIKRLSFSRARSFLELCQSVEAVPREQYDFVFKGTPAEARDYLCDLGEVPIYTMKFQKDPRNRPRKPGFFAVDIDASGSASVYLTLGHLADGEKLGGLGKICEALRFNRLQLKLMDAI